MYMLTPLILPVGRPSWSPNRHQPATSFTVPKHFLSTLTSIEYLSPSGTKETNHFREVPKGGRFITLLRRAYGTMLSEKTKRSPHHRFLLFALEGLTDCFKRSIRRTAMNRLPALAHTAERYEPRSETETRLHGHWLVLARLLWLAIFLLTLVVFCANLLVGNYGLLTTIVLVAVTSVWFAVSLVLFWSKSSDRAILVFSLLLVLTGGVFFPPIPLALASVGVWWVPLSVLE